MIPSPQYACASTGSSELEGVAERDVLGVPVVVTLPLAVPLAVPVGVPLAVTLAVAVALCEIDGVCEGVPLCEL
jgi:hypothetical protein